MKIAITGGTGFIGSHLARRLTAEGHDVVLLARGSKHKTGPVDFISSDLSNPEALEEAFAACDAVAHCAGINREIGAQTYANVHIKGTRNVIAAAQKAGVKRVVLISFLRARPNCGSPYHESKWAAEEIVRHSGLEFTIIKPGMVYGSGDHMLDHLSHAVYTFPIFAMVGFEEKRVRPLAIEDLVLILRAALIEERLAGKTIPVTGPEETTLTDVVNRVANVVGRRVEMFRAPLWFHQALAAFCELTMKVPMVARAQVRILREGVVESTLAADPLPDDLVPTTKLTPEQIQKGLPPPGPFTLRDLRFCHD